MLGRISRLLRIQPTGPEDGDSLLLLSGTSVPTDGSSGYATGCLFQKTDGGNGTSLYVNEGTATSCDFNAVVVAA